MNDAAPPRDVRAWLAEFRARLGVKMRCLRGAPIPTGDDGQKRYLMGDITLTE